MCALPKLAVVILALLPKPDSAPGWAWQREPRMYSPDTLYEYINGSADLYLSYGFREAAVGDYVKAGEEGHWITVDVYDMGAPVHAFGIYGSERPPDVEPGSWGAQGHMSDGVVAFWQGGYYVKVMLIDGGDEAALRAFAGAAAEALPGGAEMPAELARLPREGRVAESERYVKTSALGHRFLREVVSAEYKLGEGVATLHIADLGTPEEAADGLAKLREFEETAGEGVEEMHGVGEESFGARDGHYGEMVAARDGRFVLLCVAESAARPALADLLRAAEPLLAEPVEEESCEAQ